MANNNHNIEAKANNVVFLYFFTKTKPVNKFAKVLPIFCNGNKYAEKVSMISPLPLCFAINFISNNIDPPDVQCFIKVENNEINNTKKRSQISQLFVTASLYLLSAKTNSFFSFKKSERTIAKTIKIKPIIHIHFNLPTRSCGVSNFSLINDVTIEINVAAVKPAIIGGNDNSETVVKIFF